MSHEPLGGAGLQSAPAPARLRPKAEDHGVAGVGPLQGAEVVVSQRRQQGHLQTPLVHTQDLQEEGHQHGGEDDDDGDDGFDDDGDDDDDDDGFDDDGRDVDDDYDGDDGAMVMMMMGL